MAKPNRWVDFIRKWAKDNDTTYSCALSNPKCKDAYRAKYGIKKAVPARTERERMGLEDVNVKPVPKKKRIKDIAEEVIAAAKAKPDKPPKKKKLLIIEDDLERAERKSMGSEDVNRAGVEPIRVKKITIGGVVYLVDKATKTKFFDFKTQSPIEDPRKGEPSEREFKDFFTTLYRNARLLAKNEDALIAFRQAYKIKNLTKSQEKDVIYEDEYDSRTLLTLFHYNLPEWLRQHIIDLWKRGERGVSVTEKRSADRLWGKGGLEGGGSFYRL